MDKKITILKTPLTECGGIKVPTQRGNPEKKYVQDPLVKWFKAQYPKTLITSMKNEAKRSWGQVHYDKKSGLCTGALDLFIICPNKKYHGLWIECKWGYNKLTPMQESFIVGVVEAGYDAAVVYDIDTGIKVITKYMKDR